MKKLMILCLALCLLLGGCGSFESGSAGTGSPDPSGPASATRAAKEPASKTVQYEPRDLNEGSGDEKGYYHIAAAKSANGADPSHCNIFYIDYATKQEIYLCNKPDCKHDNENCSSYLSGGVESEYGILAADSALYLLHTPMFGGFGSIGDDGSMSGEKAPVPAIYRMQPDGTGRTKVLEIESGLQISGPYVYGDGKLYCCGAKTQTKDQGNGIISAESGDQTVMEFDLEKKTARVVSSITYDQLIGGYQEKLILCRYQFPVDPGTLLDDDGAYMENFRKATGKLVFFDPVSGTEEAFYEANSSDTTGMIQWRNKIYFTPARKTSTVLSLDLDTRKIATVTDRLPAGRSYVSCEYGALLCTYYDDKEVNAEVTSCYQINPETGAVAPMSLMIEKPYGPIRILEEYGAYYLVVSDYLSKEEKTWAGTVQVNIQGTVYSLLKKSDYQASKPNYVAIEPAK